MELINDKEDLIKYYNFNEDASCITLGTKTGFKIITCNPFKSYLTTKLEREIDIIEMYHSSNILVIKSFEKNKLIIWDDNKKRIIREMRLLSHIRLIRIIKNILFVVTDLKTYLFNFEDLSLIYSFEIFLTTQKELISFNIDKNIIIAYVNKNKKSFYIKKINPKSKFNDIESQKDIEIKNNDGLRYNYLQLNKKGSIIAAACEGKVLLYKISNKENIKTIGNNDLKDGKINCICFNDNDKFLAISNEKGNIYIFDISTQSGNILNIFDYFTSTEKFAYYNIKLKEIIIRFDKDGYLMIMASNGEYFKISFDKEKGGKCKQIENKKIFK
jgi:autophagy-related protein 18